MTQSAQLASCKGTYVRTCVSTPSGDFHDLEATESTPRVVLQSYCQRKVVGEDHFRFLFEGERVKKDDTPCASSAQAARDDYSDFTFHS